MEKKLLYAVYFIALLELALSQVHIGVITEVYSSTIGIYLFSFIVCGLISMLQISKLQADKPQYLYSLVSLIASIVFGIIYVYMLVTDQEVVLYGFEAIQSGVILAVIGIIGYVIVALFNIKLLISSRSING